MTKPIEGWVIINNDNNGEANRYTSEHVGGDYIEVFTSEEGALDVSGDGETVRSVKITFTDELVTKEQYEKAINAWGRDIDVQNAIADAIRKEREWFWERLIETGFVCRSELHYKEKIFGEEK